jgi:hypothetical protein
MVAVRQREADSLLALLRGRARFARVRSREAARPELSASIFRADNHYGVAGNYQEYLRA